MAWATAWGPPRCSSGARAEQQNRFLRPIATGEQKWCQLFSEPGAGSDLAGLATRALPAGDEWVVNGQKVWTTMGHESRYGMLLARTDPALPKHRGLTFFVLDMQQPGVDVRPLVQMTGDAEFNEVYLTDARVPDSHRVGGVGDGWRVAMTTLMNERVMLGGSVPARGGGPIGAALQEWKARIASGRAPDVVLRDELAHWWVQAEVLRLTNIRAGQTRTSGTPGPDGSIGKLLSAELNKKIWAFTDTLLGMEGTLYPDGYTMARTPTAELQHRGTQWQFLRAFANSIEGGTTEIMRNILAERVLGLPGDARVDKGLAWSDIPRS